MNKIFYSDNISKMINFKGYFYSEHCQPCWNKKKFWLIPSKNQNTIRQALQDNIQGIRGVCHQKRLAATANPKNNANMQRMNRKLKPQETVISFWKLHYIRKGNQSSFSPVKAKTKETQTITGYPNISTGNNQQQFPQKHHDHQKYSTFSHMKHKKTKQTIRTIKKELSKSSTRYQSRNIEAVLSSSLNLTGTNYFIPSSSYKVGKKIRRFRTSQNFPH